MLVRWHGLAGPHSDAHQRVVVGNDRGGRTAQSCGDLEAGLELKVSVVITPLIAIILGAIAFGGGIYETLLVDRVWPGNLAIIQPKHGGLDRKLFWGPIHTLYEIALLASAWTLWSDSYARSWIIVALIAHFVSRVWSFAYFIPKAMRFENLSALTDPELHLARQWTRLSRCRPVLEAVSIVSLGAVILYLGRSVH